MSCQVNGNFEQGGAVFYGTEIKAVDSKGRVVIPSRHRRNPSVEGEEGFFAFLGPGFYILLYSPREWEKITTKISKAQSQGRDVFDDLRFFFADAQYLPLDKQGRVALPAWFITEKCIGDEAVILGVGNHLEIWGRGAYEAKRKETGIADSNLLQYLRG